MTITPGDVWCDTAGVPIQAHEGGLLRDVDGVFYWYGEDKGAPNSGNGRVDVIGVHCYASRDLVNWEDRGVVLATVPDDESHDLFPANVLERPKVVRCPATGKYVLWAHVDSPDYAKASLGVAVADAPDGPFSYRYSFRPEGRDSRDMTVFQDEDGAAYVFFSSEGACPPERQWPKNSNRHTFRNATLRIARLTDDFTSIAGASVEAFPGEMREAPAVWKWGGRYYMVTSGCTGWNPNPAEWHVADSPLGPWKTMGDPVVGTEAQRATTFDAQSTYVLPDPSGDPDRFVFCADRWKPGDLQDSRYVWLPLVMGTDGAPRIEWRDAWTPGATAVS